MIGEVIKLPEYNELISKAINWDYGTSHSHEEISDIMKIPKNTHKYHSMISRANKKLIENARMLVNEKGKGYNVVAPDEYVEMSHKEAKRATRHFRKSYKISDYAPIEKMSEDGLSRYRNYSDRLGTLRAITEGVYKEITTLVKQPLKLNSGRN